MRMEKTTNGVLIHVRVKPRAPSFRIAVHDELVVFCRRPPVDGKANRELITGLSKILGSKVQIVSGFHSSKKRILIKGLGEDEIEDMLIAAGNQK
jgi:uncharacterized protein (TIGR00251 family)